MIVARNIPHSHLIALSPGWIVFLAWVKDKGVTLDHLKKMLARDPDCFITYFSTCAEMAGEEFEEYTQESQENEEDVSSFLLSLITERNN